MYFWTSSPVGETADLVTLHCRSCGDPTEAGSEVPLLSVLRDTFGDSSTEDDRLSYIWLLSVSRLTVRQRILSAVPFFYWRLGSSGASSGSGIPAPLLNAAAPLHPVMAQAGRSIVQWAALDPMTTAVRASSRSYEANRSDIERLHLEQAIDYLQSAPADSSSSGLPQEQINILIARLELRKSLLGGLLISQQVAHFGQQTVLEEQRIRARNSEVLRQFAEKSGTWFEPLSLAGSSTEFGILWFPADAPRPVFGTAPKPIWKLLNIRDPWSDTGFSDSDLAHWRSFAVERSFDDAGYVLPVGRTGTRTRTLIPLAVYSLSYPQMPLLLVDFRKRYTVRRHEMLQRTITELTSGIIGISHFTNWYFYAGEFAYNTVWARRGIASNQADRLDSYARFQAKLALDRQLDPALRLELERRAKSLVVSPLDSDPTRSIANARLEYARLEAASGKTLLSRLDRERRAELAAFNESTRDSVLQNTLHLLSFGAYTHRVSESNENVATLKRDRHLSDQLDFLDSALLNGTDPRIAYDPAQLDEAALQVRELLPAVTSAQVRQHAHATLARLHKLSSEDEEMANTSQLTHSTRASP